jgi:hypothetical protein
VDYKIEEERIRIGRERDDHNTWITYQTSVASVTNTYTTDI